MFILKDYVPDKCLTNTEYNEVMKGVVYAPVRFNLLVFKCEFGYAFDENILERWINRLNNLDVSRDALETQYQSLIGSDVSVTLFRSERFLTDHCFPITDQGRKYVFLTCEDVGTDIAVYKPDFSMINSDGIGICQIPLTVELVKEVTKRRGFLGIFGSRNQNDYVEYRFNYELCSGYSDGDIFYEVVGFYQSEEQKLIIPITKKALENKYICINTNGYDIRFGCKNRIRMK